MAHTREEAYSPGPNARFPPWSPSKTRPRRGRSPGADRRGSSEIAGRGGGERGPRRRRSGGRDGWRPGRASKPRSHPCRPQCDRAGSGKWAGVARTRPSLPNIGDPARLGMGRWEGGRGTQRGSARCVVGSDVCFHVRSGHRQVDPECLLVATTGLSRKIAMPIMAVSGPRQRDHRLNDLSGGYSPS